MADELRAMDFEVNKIKPMDLPKIKPIGSESVSKRQSLQEWHAAGGGVPKSHKNQSDVWHKKVQKYAAGGEVFNTTPDMSDGGEIIQAESFARGGAVNMARGGGTKKSKDRPFYEPFTQGLGPMLYGAARGTAAGVAGAPGDIEELGRMGINYAGELAGRPNLVNEEAAFPTSERILKKLPSLKDLGAGKEAQHSEDIASKLGMFGISQLVAPKVGSMLGKGIKTAGKELGETAARKIASGEPLIPGFPASLTNPLVMNIIKPEGGNWRGGTKSVENRLSPLKESSGADKPEAIRGNPQKVYEDKIASIDTVIGRMKDANMWNPQTEDLYAGIKKQAKNDLAVDKWVDSNLSNYMKKQMGSESDPIRKLADEGITHYPDLGIMRTDLNSGYNQYVRNNAMRKKLGMPASPIAQTNLGKTWEEGIDALIGSETQPLSKYGTAARRKKEPWMANLSDDTLFYGVPSRGGSSDLGFDHLVDVLRDDLRNGRIQPDQLNKVSVKQAVERASQYNQDKAKDMANAVGTGDGGFPIYKDYPDKGYKWIELKKSEELPEGWTVDVHGNTINPAGNYAQHPGQKKLEEALNYEGKAMGHCVGSYCDEVSAGGKKIYSLRDAKGKPHVTVEVLPGKGRESEQALFKEHERARQLDPDNTPEDFNRWAEMNDIALDAGTTDLPTIRQIKGNQNRAPNPEYLPYVQDFVKSGKWADVGDLRNSGLIEHSGKYFTEPELIEAAKKYGRMGVQDTPWEVARQSHMEAGIPEDRALENWIEAFKEGRGKLDFPPEGQKQGGEVHMALGGAAIKAALSKLGKSATESDLKAIKDAGRLAHEQEAGIRALKNAEIEKKLESMPPRSKAANLEMGMYHPVGGGLKLTKPFEALHSTRVANPKIKMPEVKIMTPEDLYYEKAGFFPLVGDKADTGTFLTHIGEKELDVPVGLGGGPRYMDANYNIKSPSESAAWESGTGRTTSLGNQAQRIGESGNPVYGIYTAGSGTNTDFNVMGANALLQQLGQSKLTKKAEKAFDQAMRQGTKAFPAVPNWPGIRSPEVEDLLLDKSNGILRTKLFDTMGKENFQSMGFPDIPATRKAIMDPLLYETPTHESGFRIARMDPTGRLIENPLNPSDYPTAMAGEVAGQLDKGVDYKDMFSTHFNNRRLLSQPESGDYYSFSRAHPIQYADQEWLDSIMKAQEKKDKIIKTGKYAKGGLAAATKSRSTDD
jgi:hypothetical protein